MNRADAICSADIDGAECWHATYFCENPCCGRQLDYPPYAGLCDDCEMKAQDDEATTVRLGINNR